jgi:hypothetical protein
MENTGQDISIITLHSCDRKTGGSEVEVDPVSDDDVSSVDDKLEKLSEKERTLNDRIQQEISKNPNRLPKATLFIIPNEFCERQSKTLQHSMFVLISCI